MNGNRSPIDTANVPVASSEPRFWTRYSPHHELPISGAGSLAIHALVIALLLAAGALAAWLGLKPSDKLPQVQIVQMDAPQLPDDGTVGEGGARQEAVEPDAGIPIENDKREPKVGALPKVSKENSGLPKELLRPEGTRPVPVGDEPNVFEKLEERIKGIGVVRTEPAPPKSVGPKGPGGPSVGNLRVNRQRRWTMIFDTVDGRDYLQQLDALGAIIGVPEGDRFRIVRDLRREIKTDGVLDRMHWFDDNPKSVAGLADVLGIKPPPPRIVAFFPPELETKLLAIELRYQETRRGKKDERAIRETYFRLRRQGNNYEPVVVSQRYQ